MGEGGRDALLVHVTQVLPPLRVLSTLPAVALACMPQVRSECSPEAAIMTHIARLGELQYHRVGSQMHKLCPGFLDTPSSHAD